MDFSPKIINTDLRTFLVKFQFKSTNGTFICNWKGLPECLKQNEEHGHGVEYIKEFDPPSAKFKRVSKADLLELYKDTENEDFINSYHYFN